MKNSLMSAISADAAAKAAKLFAEGASERKVATALGISRRQASKLQQRIKADQEDDPLCEALQPSMSRSDAVAELVHLSTRPEGVRPSEMWPVLRALFGMCLNTKTGAMELDMTNDQLRYLKDKTAEAAAAQGKTALFIPEWMPREDPVTANGMLTTMAGWLHERAQEYASEFMASFPGVSSKHVLKELVCLAFQQASAEPVQTRCERNAETALQLQQRLGGRCRMRAANEPYPSASTSDPELERLCI
ncbi:helix-turn-helix domain-containing protein [Stutzerimonas stutzeri]|uniref:helix-turn-helix domain-containing protein n=1 Tax=Stutzerimonas stutzeri TaxID=316 RepID=UPI000F7B90B2|nr:helix-turn-helix domain-containing protein [Stutzerimonas stutzeri]MCQ4239696.1 helix-turn-helix domain-containing protein [Stutzerimonas stutzeri]RRV65103.1 hypothetical protein EGJ07_06755 [Stutzerimonas stutzeri]